MSARYISMRPDARVSVWNWATTPSGFAYALRSGYSTLRSHRRNIDTHSYHSTIRASSRFQLHSSERCSPPHPSTQPIPFQPADCWCLCTLDVLGHSDSKFAVGTVRVLRSGHDTGMSTVRRAARKGTGILAGAVSKPTNTYNANISLEV